jgi:hypothetical protein
MRYLNALIDTLREELQQYGEMLARFDDAEAYVALDSAPETLRKGAALHEQEQVLNLALAKREHARRRLARSLCLPEEGGLTAIVPLLPREHQLLMQALMEENQELSSRVQRRASLERHLPPRSLLPVPSCFLAA